jgi:hypothetical protein
MPLIAPTEERPMPPFSANWPQSAHALLAQAKRESNLVKLIMAGTTHIESWLIENLILPGLQDRKLTTLRFEELAAHREQRSASLVPLPDGSAFARHTSGLWSALENQEALHEIQYIGFRFAPGDHWQAGFIATSRRPDQAEVAVTPSEVANIWQQITDTQVAGFEAGALDQMEAFGLGVIDKLLRSHGRLGL